MPVERSKFFSDANAARGVKRRGDSDNDNDKASKNRLNDVTSNVGEEGSSIVARIVVTTEVGLNVAPSVWMPPKATRLE